MKYTCTNKVDLGSFTCSDGFKMSNEIDIQKVPELIKQMSLLAMQANYQCFVEKEHGYAYAISNYKHVLSQLNGIWISD